MPCLSTVYGSISFSFIVAIGAAVATDAALHTRKKNTSIKISKSINRSTAVIRQENPTQASVEGKGSSKEKLPCEHLRVFPHVTIRVEQNITRTEFPLTSWEPQIQHCITFLSPIAEYGGGEEMLLF